MVQLQNKISVLDETYPSQQALTLIANKWTVLVIYALARSPKRFNHLRKKLDGITQKMLTKTLRQLEIDGILTRTVYATNPPQVEYELTPLGKTLIKPLNALRNWAETYYLEIEQNRVRFQG